MPSREWDELRDDVRPDGRCNCGKPGGRTKHSQRVLAERTSTVDRLLDFSQTIQGAGQADQVFTTLSQFLETELKLAGIAILSHQPDAMPPIAGPGQPAAELFVAGPPVAEMNGALCPCLRQNLPRQFRPDGSPGPLRDRRLPLAARRAHPAYCIPFNVGRQHAGRRPHAAADRRDLDRGTPPARPDLRQHRRSSLISLHLLAEAEKQSMTDALTGLYNRRSMEQLLQREVALAERHGHPLSVVMIDMDQFKQVNDTHGHAAGDHLLKSFADCVRITLRKTDLAFRYGGDEFVIALPQTPHRPGRAGREQAPAGVRGGRLLPRDRPSSTTSRP